MFPETDYGERVANFQTIGQESAQRRSQPLLPTDASQAESAERSPPRGRKALRLIGADKHKHSSLQKPRGGVKGGGGSMESAEQRFSAATLAFRKQDAQPSQASLHGGSQPALPPGSPARRGSIGPEHVKVVPVAPPKAEVGGRRYHLDQAYSSQADLAELGKARWNRDRFAYRCEFASQQYHLVRHKYDSEHGRDDQIELLPNDSKIPIKLPNVKMHLQPDRPPNLARAHDARFENINRDPKILSKTKVTPTISFDKLPRRETSTALINRNTVLHSYNPDDGRLRKRTDFSFVNIAKQRVDKEPVEVAHTHDELAASRQRLENTSGSKVSQGGVNGPIPMHRQGGPRQFAQHKKAQESEQHEKAIHDATTEEHKQRARQKRQEQIMAIHSRLNNKSGPGSRKPSP